MRGSHPGGSTKVVNLRVQIPVSGLWLENQQATNTTEQSAFTFQGTHKNDLRVPVLKESKMKINFLLLPMPFSFRFSLLVTRQEKALVADVGGFRKMKN